MLAVNNSHVQAVKLLLAHASIDIGFENQVRLKTLCTDFISIFY